MQPTVTIEIGADLFLLVFDFEAVAEAEDLTGRALLTGLTSKDARSPAINLVRGMFYACTRAHHAELDFAAIKSRINRKNIWEVWAKVLEAWTAGLVDPESDAARADPTQAPSSVGASSGAISGVMRAMTSE